MLTRPRQRRLPTRVNTPDQHYTVGKQKAESNAIWFGIFAAAVVLVIMLVVFASKHLILGPLVALYVVLPLLAGVAMYFITRPKGPAKAPKKIPDSDTIESVYRD